MKIEWKLDIERNEVTLFVDEERRGGIIEWKDRITGIPTGWTGVQVMPDGTDREISGDDGFWESECSMKTVLLKAVGLLSVDEVSASKADLTVDLITSTLEEVRKEVQSATSKWPPLNSAHEGYGVLMEELDELWEHVKTNQKRRDLPAMRAEALQVAAVAVRFAVELCDEERGRK